MVRMTMVFVLLASALLAEEAAAQVVYKCLERGKPPVFQNAPCPAALRTARAVAYVPDPDARPYQPNVRSRPYAQRLGTARGSTISVQRDARGCTAARARRDAVLGPNNQGGNVDVRRRLNDEVAKHCY